MNTKLLILIVSFILISNFAFADSVYLKSGREIDGWILEITDEYVKIDAGGIPLVFFFDTIDGINVEEYSPYITKLVMTEEGKQFSSVYEVSMWITYYYLNPDSKRLLPALEVALRNRTLWEPEQRANPIIHFFATAFREDKEEIDKLRTLLNESDYFQRTILNKIIYEAVNPKDIKADGAESFDLLWAEFFATGKSEPVLKLIKSLNWRVGYDDLLKFGDLSVLVWSLSANAEQHSRVKRICEQELKKRWWGLVRKRLYQALNTPSGELYARYTFETIIRAERLRNKSEYKNIFGRIKGFFTNIRDREKFDERIFQYY